MARGLNILANECERKLYHAMGVPAVAPTESMLVTHHHLTSFFGLSAVWHSRKGHHPRASCIISKTTTPGSNWLPACQCALSYLQVCRHSLRPCNCKKHHCPDGGKNQQKVRVISCRDRLSVLGSILVDSSVVVSHSLSVAAVGRCLAADETLLVVRRGAGAGTARND